MHEARLHKYNSFITLTYDDEHLPEDYNLRHYDYQTFIKRLRESALQGEVGKSTILHQRHTADGRHEQRAVVRYHMCGEYGPTTGRQHYHANLFGINFADRKPWKKTPAGYQLYKSETLDKIWGNGHASIGTLTWQTAAYTARYNLKKAGDKNKKEIEILDVTTGEVIKRTAEYQRMSRNPGIGAGWFEQYKTDVYPHGTVTVNGSQIAPPRFYDEKFRRLDPFEYNALKFARRAHNFAREYISAAEIGPRTRAEETVLRAKLSFLKRNGDIT